jgi:hypothetical protein
VVSIHGYYTLRNAYKVLVATGATTPDSSLSEGKFIDAYHNAVAFNFMNALNRGDISVFYCNDSVMGGHNDEEKRTTIAEMLEKLSGMNIYPVSGAGYTAVLFRDYAGLVAKARQRPHLAIISVNLRSFSDDWLFTPRWEYAATAAYLRLLADEASLGDMLHWVWSGQQDPAAFWLDRARLTATPYGELFQRLNGRRDALLAEAAPGLSPEDLSRRTHFINNYMTQISPDHPMLGYLSDTAHRLTQAGVDVLFYLTPIDIQGGAQLVGKEFAATVADNSHIIVQTLRAAGAACLDLTTLLPQDRFVDREYACEHLDLEGRRRVAEALAAAIGQTASGAASTGGRARKEQDQ